MNVRGLAEEVESAGCGGEGERQPLLLCGLELGEGGRARTGSAGLHFRLQSGWWGAGGRGEACRGPRDCSSSSLRQSWGLPVHPQSHVGGCWVRVGWDKTQPPGRGRQGPSALLMHEVGDKKPSALPPPSWGSSSGTHGTTW